MTVRSFVDTNVWVHAVDGAEAAKQQRARSVLEGLDSSSTVVSAQVLNEYYVAVTRKLAQPLSQADATTAVRGIADLEVVAIAGPLVLRGIDRARDSDLSLWDALIVEAVRAADCEVLLTEDLNADQDFGGVQVQNPFVPLDQ
jgi:predicted nucleic acid-binding protein